MILIFNRVVKVGCSSLPTAQTANSLDALIMHPEHLLLLPYVSRIRFSTTGRQTLKKQIASCSHGNKIPVLLKNNSQKAVS